MSEYLPFNSDKPCHICGDTSGNCSISEYGYTLLCEGSCAPETKEGDLRGFWKCFRSNEEYSQWEDQRTRLEAKIKPPKKIIISEPNFLSEIVEQSLKRHIQKKGGEKLTLDEALHPTDSTNVPNSFDNLKSR